MVHSVKKLRSTRLITFQRVYGDRSMFSKRGKMDTHHKKKLFNLQ